MSASLTRYLPAGSRLEALIRPTPGRLGFALRMALICALITVVIEVYQLPSLATTVYAAFFLLRPTRGSTVLAAIVMPIFITVALAVTLMLTATVLDHPFWRVMTMALFSFAVLFLGSASKLKPFAPTFAVIVGYVLDLLGGLQIGEIATRALLYTWLVAAIPAGICIAVSLVTGPAPRRLLGNALADRLHLAAQALRTGAPAVVARVDAALRQGDAGLQDLLTSARLEKALTGETALALSRAIGSTLAILTHVSLIGSDPLGYSTERAAIAEILDRMAQMLRAGGYPVDIVAPMIGQDTGSGDMARLLRSLCDELAAFAQNGDLTTPATASGFMLPDAFTNPAHARFALKATAAAMACYLTFQQLDWAGIHTSLITCYVVSLGSTGETVEKLALRLGGCLVGAAMGFAVLIFILPQVESITGLIAVIIAGALPSAWVAAGGPRVSYAGFQIAFAYFMIVLQGPAPAFDLSLGRDRIIGIIFGNLMVYLIFTRVWPSSICTRIDPALARLARALGEMAGGGSEGRARRIGPIRNAVAALAREINLARLEPPSLRPSDRWLAEREAALARLDRLQTPLFLATVVDEASAWLAAFARQLESDPAAGDNLPWASLNLLPGMHEVHHVDT